MNQPSPASLRDAVNQVYLAAEHDIVDDLLRSLDGYDPVRAGDFAKSLVESVRSQKHLNTAIQAFLHEYQLNSREGIVLMGIAEALLRIPDSRTQDRFLQDKLTRADWRAHLLQSDSLLVQMTNRALSFTSEFEGRLLSKDPWFPVFEQLLGRMGAPLIRSVIRQAMRRMALQFVFADSMQEAVQVSGQYPERRFSFDMLGEAALTADDAERYFQAYLDAIGALSACAPGGDIHDNPGISVKLSALCPRYEPLQHRRAIPELAGKLLILANAARAADISLTVDAEESERLDMSLEIFADVFQHPDVSGWEGLGLAVQAYQKRALAVVRWLAALAESRRCRIPLRLVKGAYWDSEIKRAQENGLEDYPVFTHKSMTDVSYLACARFILSKPAAFYPQFASHNAHTVAAVYQSGAQHPGYEFQRLHGMGESLYRGLGELSTRKIPCRVYAPVGDYRELLPYLVRRLLENAANTSFINQIDHPEFSVEELARDPVETVRALPQKPQIALPRHLFGEQRLNSRGFNLADPVELGHLQQDLAQLAAVHWTAGPGASAGAAWGKVQQVVNPGDNRQVVGSIALAEAADVESALTAAHRAFNGWRLCPAGHRADRLEQAAHLLEQARSELVSLCVREGGRTIRDALAEIREAVDYCRYYAQMARALCGESVKMPGPTGEDNRLYHYGRGVFVCISPWNFPIAIFIGQVAAALAAGNTVIAKPATQTVLTAMRCIQLLYQAGIPEDVLQFLPATGGMTGQMLVPDARVAGVAFTGSTLTAQTINRQLAGNHPDIIPLIAETGGQNVMIADSSALPEQLVQDVVVSAYNSAGQRCSALRVLCVQEDIADRVIGMLIGAMRELRIGDPGIYSTDIGPVIDRDALAKLTAHVESMKQEGTLLYQSPLEETLRHGSFFPPTLIEIRSLSQLRQEVFGPILHVIRFHDSELERVIAAVNATGYGLTLGIHSRIEATIQTIRQGVRVGNVYVNRNMIGAVVGVQPFGGMGLSGTGPKAGGPNYLNRFVVEQTVTINTAAIGGNAALLARDLR
ncbi:MAG: bifunctional proline dehydrogenase/L-glutamate gamma-semialdehyde dehydrogenase PutA [Gammaproteobacteria bacterium]